MSNDLISRKKLMDALRGNVLVEVTPELEDAIAELPIAYDVDKVLEQLEEMSHYMVGYGRAKEIVKAGGVNDQKDA